MKYIDADRLKELLDAKYKEFREKGYREDATCYYFADGLDVAMQLVDSLQQEQQIGEEYAIEMGKHTHTLRVGSQSDIDNLIRQEKQERPEPYFYCKYGGTIPLCSDCKRNHNNSSFKTEEITTWYAPSNGTKHCADYIQKEQPEIDLEKEVEKFCLEYDSRKEVWFDMTPRDKKMLSIPTWSNFAANIARHFYELGKKGNKELNKKSKGSNDSDMGSPWRNRIIEEL